MTLKFFGNFTLTVEWRLLINMSCFESMVQIPLFVSDKDKFKYCEKAVITQKLLINLS